MGWKTAYTCYGEFFERHRDFNIYAMTADSGFDYVTNYKYLFENHGILSVIAFILEIPEKIRQIRN